MKSTRGRLKRTDPKYVPLPTVEQNMKAKKQCQINQIVRKHLTFTVREGYIGTLVF